VTLSIEGSGRNDFGLDEVLLVVYGTARVTEGGAPELLQDLAHTYLGPRSASPDARPPSGSSRGSRRTGFPASAPGLRAAAERAAHSTGAGDAASL